MAEIAHTVRTAQLYSAGFHSTSTLDDLLELLPPGWHEQEDAEDTIAYLNGRVQREILDGRGKRCRS